MSGIARAWSFVLLMVLAKRGYEEDLWLLPSIPPHKFFGARLMRRYSAFAIARESARYHTGWERAWRSPEPKKEYEVVIVGAGGAGMRAAIEAGYDRAISTIIDSNLTTLFAALFLFIFGSGPIKGFAVTLSLGIITSMFTAILVTRLIITLYVNRTRPKLLSL